MITKSRTIATRCIFRLTLTIQLRKFSKKNIWRNIRSKSSNITNTVKQKNWHISNDEFFTEETKLTGLVEKPQVLENKKFNIFWLSYFYLKVFLQRRGLLFLLEQHKSHTGYSFWSVHSQCAEPQGLEQLTYLTLYRFNSFITSQISSHMKINKPFWNN